MKEIVLDTETTGLSVKEGHRIVEIGCIELDNLIPTNNVFHCYLNPERKVSESALKVHGYTDEFLSFLYISITSLSALKVGQLNNFEIKDFPEAILPSTQTLIINPFSNFYIHLPPSTSSTAPVIMLASSEHKKQAAFPISCGVENLPIGIVERNACFFLLELPPINDFNNGVFPATGAIALTLTL